MPLPFPRHLEEKTTFVARFQSSSEVKRLYPDFHGKHDAAMAAWERARGESEVSFEGALTSFMLFVGER